MHIHIHAPRKRLEKQKIWNHNIHANDHKLKNPNKEVRDKVFQNTIEFKFIQLLASGHNAYHYVQFIWPVRLNK